MKDLALIIPEKPSNLLNKMIAAVIENKKHSIVENLEAIRNLQNKTVIHKDICNVNEMDNYLKYISDRSE